MIGRVAPVIAPLTEGAGGRVDIVRPDPRATGYELHAAGRVVGTVQRRSRVSRVARAEAADGFFTLRAAGHPFTVLTAEDEDGAEAARLDTATEVLTLRDGRTLRWTGPAVAGGWSALVADPDEVELMRLRVRVTGRRRGELELDPAAADAPAARSVLSVLALLGAYRVILEADRAPARAPR